MEISNLIPIDGNNRGRGLIGVHHIDGNRITFVVVDLFPFASQKQVMQAIADTFGGTCWARTAESLGIQSSEAARQHYVFTTTVKSPVHSGSELQAAAKWFRMVLEAYDREAVGT